MPSLKNRTQALLKKPALRQGAIVLFDQGFLSIATFITGVLVARSVSKDDYALYLLIFSFLLIISSVHRALVTLPLTIHLPRLSEKEQNIYMGSGLMITFIIGLVTGVGLVIYAAIAHNNESPDADLTRQVILILTFLILPYLTREYIRNALFAKLHFFSSLIANFTATLLQLTGVSLLYYYDHLTITNTLTIIFLSMLIAASVMLWSHRKIIHLKPEKIYSDFSRGLRITGWALLNVLGFIGSSQAFIWLLLIIMDKESVAIYGASFALSSVMAPFLRAMNAYILPRMSHSYKDGNKSSLKHMLHTSVIALFIPYGIWTLIGSIFAEQLMDFLYTDAYQGHAALVSLLLIKSMIESVSAPLTSTLQTLDKTHITTVSLLIGSIITIIGGSIMINSYGLIGAGIIAVISIIVRTGWQYHYINKRL